MLPYFGRSFLRMNHLSNLLRRDMLNQFNRSLATMDMINNENYFPQVNDNAYYEMKVSVNDNGNMKVKTMSKEPGKEWNVKVEEYYNKSQSPSLEQEKATQKKPEALEQEKTTRAQAESKPQVQTQTQERIKVTEAPQKHEENRAKENRVNVSESSPKQETQKIETAREQKPHEKSEKKPSSEEYLSRRRHSPYDEFETMFDRMERDFEESFGRDFGVFDYGFAPRYRSPFAEMDAQFARMERDFEEAFRRPFDFYDPFFYRGRRNERPQSLEGKEREVRNEGKKSESGQREEAASANK